MNKEEYKKRLIGTFPSLYGFIVGCFDEASNNSFLLSFEASTDA